MKTIVQSLYMLFGPLCLCASVPLLPDTIVQQPVVVVVRDWNESIRSTSQSRFAFTRKQLELLAPSQARDVLVLVPGVFVRDYGGASALQTVSFRGGSSSQALVMLDGARFSSAQNGSADISMIPMRYVASVDVTRGGASALYGANASHGSVDMKLRLPANGGYQLSAMGGSFDQWLLSAGATQRLGSAVVGVDVEALGSAGSFPFTTSQFGSVYEINRQNNDVRSHRAIVRVEDSDAYSATVLVRSADRGVPGAIVQGNITQARARLHDDDALGIWSLRLLKDSATRLRLVGSARYLDQAFRDPDATIVGSQGIDVRYIQRDITQSLTAEYPDVIPDALYRTNIRARIDASYADIRGPLLQEEVIGTIDRGSVAATVDADVSGFESGGDATPWMARAAIRSEVFTDIGLVVSPLASFRMPLGAATMLRALWSYNVRPPSFNELYYLNYGTKNLRPERSSTSEIGLHVQPTDWFDVAGTVYYMSTRDVIVSVPVSPVITSAQNVGLVTTYGAEFIARASLLTNRLRWQYSYTYMMATDATGRPYLDGTMLPYSPPETFSSLLMWNDDHWFTSTTISYTSFRYHSVGNNYASLLQPFTVVGLQGGVRVRSQHSTVDIRLQCDNLFDERYVVVRGFPMPGRTVRLAVSMGLEQ